MCRQQGQVQTHAHGHEEKRKENAAERLDVAFDLRPILRLRQENARQECAQRHREPGLLGEPANTQHQEQDDTGEKLGIAAARHRPEQGADQQSAHRQDHPQCQRRLEQRDPQRRQHSSLGVVKQGDQGEQRNDRQVLAQEHREGNPSMGCGQLAALDHHLEHDGRRGQGQAAAEHQRCGALEADEPEQAVEHHPGDQDLRAPETEDVPPEGGQSRGGQGQADSEEEEHNAELCQDFDRLGLLDEAQPVRADEGAGDQVSQYRARAQLAEQRHDGDRREQDDQQIPDIKRVDHRRLLRSMHPEDTFTGDSRRVRRSWVILESETSQEPSMTSTISTTTERRAVTAVLAMIHQRWIQELRAVLGPAADLQPELWSRWGCATYLADQFGDRFRLEAAFASAIEGLISEGAARGLARVRQDIERTAEELEAVARRNDISIHTASLARLLIEETARWCVELEIATAEIKTELPAGARRLLARLRVAHGAGHSRPPVGPTG